MARANRSQVVRGRVVGTSVTFTTCWIPQRELSGEAGGCGGYLQGLNLGKGEGRIRKLLCSEEQQIILFPKIKTSDLQKWKLNYCN